MTLTQEVALTREHYLALAPEAAWASIPDTTVVVLSGGSSSERDVSVRSGAAVAGALRTDGELRGPKRVRAVEIRADGKWTFAGAEAEALDAHAMIERLGPDAVYFLALHGGQGEDGTIQGLLRACGLRHTGAGVYASALCMNKSATKDVLRRAGVVVARGVEIDRYAWNHERQALLGACVELSSTGWCVKPNSGGSSVATSLEDSVDGLAAAIERVLATGDRALVEARVVGVETSCGVMGDPSGAVLALMPIEIVPKDGRFFDYEEKYSAQGASEHCPPLTVPPAVCADIRRYAERAFRAVTCGSYARIDFMVPRAPQESGDRQWGTPVALEINTLPGMTERSLLPQEAAHAGLSFRDLCLLLLALSWTEHA